MKGLVSLAVAVVAGGVSVGLGADGGAGGKRNVLFICVDDLKPMLGCYGDSTVRSPNVDRLAGEGVRFERAYCNQAVCGPSRNALMTGLRPSSIGVYDLKTFFREGRPDAVTMGEWFKSKGWRTASLGKIFHDGQGNHTDERSWSVPAWREGGPVWVLPEDMPAAGQAKGAVVECADVPDEAYGDGKVAVEAIKRLREAKRRSEPFFLMVGFVRPHLPFVAPKKYWDLYLRESFRPDPRQTGPVGAPEWAGIKGPELRTYAGVPKEGAVDEAEQKELIHGYHAAVSYVDAQVGKVLDEMRGLGMEGNTVVVLWGDHGWHLGDHGWWGKGTNYEEATRIPLIVKWPGVTKAGGVCKGLVESVDIYPTLGEVMGVGAPAGLDGKSFAGALRDPKGARTKAAVVQCYPRTVAGVGWVLGRAVRTARYRMVEWKRPGSAAGSAVIELYDYQEDPGEMRNVASEKPAVVEELRKVLVGMGEARARVGRGGRR